MDHIDHARFADASQYLAVQREAHPFIPRGLQMIDTLAWAGKVETHLADRGGASGPIVLFRHEEPVRTLVQEWGENSFRRQQVMDQILSREPKFEHIHTQIFSSLTNLRSDNAIYVKAIDELKANLQAALKRDDRPAMAKLIDDFSSAYPRVSGVDVLRDDLVRYDTLYQLVRQKELLQLVHLRRTAQFRTPIFAEHVDAWLAKELPPSDIIARYAEAAAAWNAGNHDQAIATLQSVKTAPWGEVAVRQIARYQKIGADYADLLASKGSDGYYDRLLVVWSSLRPNEDAHLIRTLEPDFLAHRDQVLPRLDRSLERVRAYWGEYQSDGGISGVTRVEERVSPRFSGQAKRLSRRISRDQQRRQNISTPAGHAAARVAVAAAGSRRRAATSAPLAAGSQHRAGARAVARQAGSAAGNLGAIVMGTVYYRSKKGLNRFLEDHGPEGVAILTDQPSQLIPDTILVLFGLLIAAAIWSFYGKADVIVESQGMVKPESEQQGVYLPIKGELVNVYVTEGMPVEKGDLVARINSPSAIELAGQATQADRPSRRRGARPRDVPGEEKGDGEGARSDQGEDLVR